MYDRFPAVYDVLQATMQWLGGEARRRRVVGAARGKVLEVGIGTGLNLRYYAQDVDLTGIGS